MNGLYEELRKHGPHAATVLHYCRDEVEVCTVGISLILGSFCMLSSFQLSIKALW